MYLILDDGTNVCGTVDELVDFLNKYKTQHDVCTNKIYPGDGTGDDSYLKHQNALKQLVFAHLQIKGD